MHDLINGNKALLIIDGNYNIKQFGAKGNGTTDDTVSIQKTINYAQTNKSVYKIYVPVGTYLISDKIDLGYGFNQPSIIGEHTNLCKIVMSSSADAQTPIFYQKGGSGGVHCFKIQNLFFQDENNTHIGLYFEGGAAQAIISLCRFNNFDKAIKLLNSGGEFTETTKIRDCDFRNNDYCVYFGRTGSENSFHGFEIVGCTIGEKSAGEHVIYLERNCVWYNGKIEIIVWKANTKSLIYSVRESSDSSGNRYMSLFGTIRIEGNQTFNLWESSNGESRSYFCGNILGLGDNFRYGDVNIGDGKAWIHSNAYPTFAAAGTQKTYRNLMDGDTFKLNYMNSNSGYTFISGRLACPYYESIFRGLVINVEISSTARKHAIVDWTHTQLFNQFGISIPTLTMNNSDGTVTFNYSGSDKDTKKFELIVYTLPFSSQAVYSDYNADNYRPEEETSI